MIYAVIILAVAVYVLIAVLLQEDLTDGLWHPTSWYWIWPLAVVAFVVWYCSIMIAIGWRKIWQKEHHD